MDHNLDAVARAFALENDLTYALIGRFDPNCAGVAGFGTGKGMTPDVTQATAATMFAMSRHLVSMVAQQTGRDERQIAFEVMCIANSPDREETARWITEQKEPEP